MPFVISIDGNIGSGKSTLINELKKICATYTGKKICFIKEPINLWMNTCNDGLSIFDRFMQNSVRWGLTFQIYVLTTMYNELRTHINNNEYDIIILERSVYSSRHIFFEYLKQNNIVTDVEYLIYISVFDTICNSSMIDKYVYLKTDDEICYQRICNRNRNSENLLSIEYIQKLGEMYDNWIVNENHINLNGNINFIDDVCVLRQWISLIIEY
jgi:deoxyadenosine/deoxycytidine kinase